MKRFAAILAIGGCLIAGQPALADSGTQAAIHDLQSVRFVRSVNVIDVGARSDRFVFSKRAMNSNTPLTPLQVAIAGNPSLVAAIRASVWSFDLKSVYAARVDGAHVTIYLGEPPNQ